MALEALQSSPDADEHMAERDAQRMWGQSGIPDLMRVLRGLPYLSESLPQRDVEYVLIHLHNSEILPFARHRHRYPVKRPAPRVFRSELISMAAATSNHPRHKWQNASIEPQRRTATTMPTPNRWITGACGGNGCADALHRAVAPGTLPSCRPGNIGGEVDLQLQLCGNEGQRSRIAQRRCVLISRNEAGKTSKSDVQDCSSHLRVTGCDRVRHGHVLEV